MSFPYSTYTLLTSLLFLLVFPPFRIYSLLSGRYERGLRERLGLIPLSKTRQLKRSPRIWMHAVSLGEVKVAASVIESLWRISPAPSLILTTTTHHGYDLARETLPDDIPVAYAPLDTVFSVRRALRRVSPHILVFLETEIWPSWITEARRMGIRVALINGRISVRSIRTYLRFRPLFRDVLKGVDVFSMITKEDGDRIRLMGADPKKVEIHGNAKYDFLSRGVEAETEKEMRRILHLDPESQVFIAGSTREGEEAMILEAYKKIRKAFPGILLVIVPRHVERTPEIEGLLQRRGLPYQLRSQLSHKGSERTASIVIMNTFGELFRLYSIGTIVFCGASLVPLGGQNPLEPASWGKVVFYGPSMEDFQDAKTLLEENGAGIPVSDPVMLAERAIELLRHPEELKTLGTRARHALMMNQNAAERHAKVIARFL